MSTLSNDVMLRPRFQIEISKRKEAVLKSFETCENPSFVIKRSEDHIFIKFDHKDHHFWSPQLHLEIDEIDHSNCKLFGVFGPNPTLWTFFMFLHFAVACIFIILSIWCYSSISLDKDYSIPLTLMIFTIICWFVLYFFGRLGKRKGTPQMNMLYQFMKDKLTVQ